MSRMIYQSRASIGVIQSTMFEQEQVVTGGGKVAPGSTSSHVNLGEITHYNTKAQRQRPQTGKIRSSVNQGPFRVTSLASNIGNAHQQRRLTSAKGGGESQQPKGRAPLESQLSNTRDIIQSFGHLTTTAATNYNYDPQYKTSQGYPPPKPTVRQRFVPQSANPRQRLRSAHPQETLAPSNMMVVSTSKESASRFRSVARPKSGVSVKRPNLNSRRVQSGKMKVGKNPLSETQQQLKEDIFVDQNGVEIDISQLMISGNDPLSLTLGAGIVPPSSTKSVPAQARQKKQFSNGNTQKYSSRHHRQFSTKYNLTKTIYKLPSLSQCIENKILPRSSEYMRRLYSIALRNHENHVPLMSSQQKLATKEEKGSLNKVELKVDAQAFPMTTQNDLSEFQSGDITPQTLGLQQPTPIPLGPPSQQTFQKAVEDHQDEIAKRSRSFATLNVKNLQFPFDNSVHGGFTQVKQRDLNLNSNSNPDPAKLQQSPKRRRPFTAKYQNTTAIPSIDLFNNQIITEATNQISTNPLVTASNKLLPNALTQLIEQQQENWAADQYSAEVLLQENPTNSLSIVTTNNNDTIITSPKIQYVDSKAQIVIGLKPSQQQTTTSPNNGYTPKGFGAIGHESVRGAGAAADYAKIASDMAVQSPLSNNLNPVSQSSETHSSKNLLVDQREYSGQNRSQKGSSSRRHSFAESPIRTQDPVLNSFFKKSGLDNSLSQRDFVPVHFKEKNGTKFVVQMSGQGLMTKRLNSRESESQGSRSGRRGTKKKGSKARLSSTHSLNVNVQTAKNAKGKSDQSSLNDTNRLEDSEDVCIDDRGVKIMENDNSNFDAENSVSQHSRHSQSFTRNSRASFLSNKDLDHLKDSKNQGGGRPVRQAYPIRPMTAKRRASQPMDESHISLQSHSQNLLDQQMRLKQVYDNEYQKQQQKQQSGTKVIHRIPIPSNKNNSEPVFQLNSQRDNSSRHQVLVVTNDPIQVREITAIQEGSVSNMSNPLNHIQMSADRMKPIRIKSIVFDQNGHSQIREVDRGQSVLEQVTVASEVYASPKRGGDNYFSPDLTTDLFDIDDSKFCRILNQQKEEELAHAHKRFKVTMNVKRNQPAKQPEDPSTQAPQAPKPPQATLRGKRMRIQSAQKKTKKQSQERNLHVIEMINSKREDDVSTPNLGLMENSKATVHNVPPLALPTSETITEFIPASQMQSSNRQQISYSQTSMVKMRHQNDSHKILTSFNANNVRTNLKGDLAYRLIQGIDLIDSGEIPIDNLNNHLRVSTQSNQHSPLRPQPMKKFLQRTHLGDVMHSVEKLRSSVEEGQSTEAYCSQRDFAATLAKDKSFRVPIEQEESLSDKAPQVKVQLVDDNSVPKPEEPTTIEDPQLLNIDENNNNTCSRDGDDDAVIHEQEECGSSDRSKSRINNISEQSLLKNKINKTCSGSSQLKHGSVNGPIPADKESLLIGPNTKISQPASSRNVYESFVPATHSGIRSVYEAEAQALRKGLIKAHSGKSEAGGKRIRHNSDLRHFLDGKKYSQEDLSLRNSCKKSDLSTIAVPSKQQRHQSVPSSFNKYRDSNPGEKEDKQSSQQILKTRSSINFNITNIQTMVQKKPIGERPKSISPQQESAPKAIFNLEAHQKLQKEALKEAQILMEQANLHKLDPTVVNQKLIEIFKEKKGTEEITNLMDRAKQELGTQTVKSIRGLQIPFHISSMPHHQVMKITSKQTEVDRDSKATKNLSQSSYNNKVDNIHKVPSFAPKSPGSNISTVRNNEFLNSRQGGFTFAINSVGGSTNRFSRAELPQFGGVISSRIGELLGSQNTDTQAKEYLLGDSLELVLPVPSSGGKLHMAPTPIIDYSQNFMVQNQISMGSTELGQGPLKEVRSTKSSGSKALPPSKTKKAEKKKRPITANRYNMTQPLLTEQTLTSGGVASEDRLVHFVPGVIFEQQAEHQPQPDWATRRNMKSKFNMKTQEDQARQGQKFFIECRNRDTNLTPERVLTQLISQNRQSTKLRHSINSSEVTIPAVLLQSQEAILEQSMDEIESPSKRQDSPSLRKRVCSMPIKEGNDGVEIFSAGSNKEVMVEEDSQAVRDEDSSSIAGIDTTQKSLKTQLESQIFTPQPDASHGMLSQEKEQRVVESSRRVVEVQNQSMQCSLATSPLDESAITGVHAQEFQMVSSETHLQSHLSSQANFDLKSSSHSLVNSRKVLEKVQGGKYVGRSQAGSTHFSLAGNMIGSNVVNSNRSHQKNSNK